MDLHGNKQVSKYSSWVTEDKSPINHYSYNKMTQSARKSHIFRERMRKKNLSYKDADLEFRNPFPLLPATQQMLKEDSVHALMDKKEKYHSQLKVKNVGDKYPDGYIYGDNVAFKLPSYMFNKTVAIDPDEYMLNTYDHYFSGGFLSRFQEGPRSYLIRPLLNNTLWITNLDGKKKEYEMETNGDQIYNVKVQKLGHINYLSVRQKKHMSVEQLSVNEGTLKTIPVWENTSEIPYIDIKLNSDCHLGTLCVNHEFELYDVEKKETLIKHKIKEGSDKKYDLSQFDFLNASEAILMGSKVLELFDMRSENTKILSDEDEEAQACNRNCLVTMCRRDKNYAFVATKHDVVKIDLREMKVIKKWSHFLRNHPLIMTYGYIAEEDYVCVSDGKDSIFLFMDTVDNYLPFRLHPIVQTYDEFYRHVRPCDGYILEDRIDLSIAGMDFKIKDNDITIYTSNAAGDVFCYQSNKSKEYTIENSNKRFGTWVDTMPKEVKVVYKATALVDISGHEDSIRAHEEAGRNFDMYEFRNNLTSVMDSINPAAYTLSENWNKDQKKVSMSQPSQIVYNDLDIL